VMGVFGDGATTQVALLDLPGLVSGGAAAAGAPARRVRGAWAHAAGAGLALLVVDAARQAGRPDPRVVALAARVGAAVGGGGGGEAAAAGAGEATVPAFPPVALVLNKIDAIPRAERDAALARVAADLAAAGAVEGAGGSGSAPHPPPPSSSSLDPWAALAGPPPLPPPLPPDGSPLPPFTAVFALSSTKINGGAGFPGNPGLGALRAFLLSRARPGGWAVPPSPDGAPTDRGWPGVAAQAVSAELFAALHGDVPYGLDVRPSDWRTLPDGSVRVAVDVTVPRPSVRAIVLGRGGDVVRRVGTRARRALKRAMLAAADGAAAVENAVGVDGGGGGGDGGGGTTTPRPPARPAPTDVHLFVDVKVAARRAR
jgi:GTPase Era involved in 16S rRNA processing